jgi:hypothetical protein
VSGLDDVFPVARRPDPAEPGQALAVASWKTRQGEEVTIGDVVALSVLSSPDAKGKIVGAASDGLVECVLGDHEDPHGRRPRLRVEADNILMLVKKAQ